ncbi:unnamed protein product, partial [Amoebophrya sp. A120]
FSSEKLCSFDYDPHSSLHLNSQLQQHMLAGSSTCGLLGGGLSGMNYNCHTGGLSQHGYSSQVDQVPLFTTGPVDLFSLIDGALVLYGQHDFVVHALAQAIQHYCKLLLEHCKAQSVTAMAGFISPRSGGGGGVAVAHHQHQLLQQGIDKVGQLKNGTSNSTTSSTLAADSAAGGNTSNNVLRPALGGDHLHPASHGLNKNPAGAGPNTSTLRRITMTQDPRGSLLMATNCRRSSGTSGRNNRDLMQHLLFLVSCLNDVSQIASSALEKEAVVLQAFDPDDDDSSEEFYNDGEGICTENHVAPRSTRRGQHNKGFTTTSRRGPEFVQGELTAAMTRRPTGGGDDEEDPRIQNGNDDLHGSFAINEEHFQQARTRHKNHSSSKSKRKIKLTATDWEQNCARTGPLENHFPEKRTSHLIRMSSPAPTIIKNHTSTTGGVPSPRSPTSASIQSSSGKFPTANCVLQQAAGKLKKKQEMWKTLKRRMKKGREMSNSGAAQNCVVPSSGHITPPVGSSVVPSATGKNLAHDDDRVVGSSYGQQRQSSPVASTLYSPSGASEHHTAIFSTRKAKREERRRHSKIGRSAPRGRRAAAGSKCSFEDDNFANDDVANTPAYTIDVGSSVGAPARNTRGVNDCSSPRVDCGATKASEHHHYDDAHPHDHGSFVGISVKALQELSDGLRAEVFSVLKLLVDSALADLPLFDWVDEFDSSLTRTATFGPVQQQSGEHNSLSSPLEYQHQESLSSSASCSSSSGPRGGPGAALHRAGSFLHMGGGTSIGTTNGCRAGAMDHINHLQVVQNNNTGTTSSNKLEKLFPELLEAVDLLRKTLRKKSHFRALLAQLWDYLTQTFFRALYQFSKTLPEVDEQVEFGTSDIREKNRSRHNSTCGPVAATAAASPPLLENNPNQEEAAQQLRGSRRPTAGGGGVAASPSAADLFQHLFPAEGEHENDDAHTAG